MLHAARDQAILGYAGFLPNLILPPVLGHSIDHWPGGRHAAYREMFIGAAVFQFLGACCFLAIRLPSNVKPGEGLWPWLRRSCGKGVRGGGGMPPLGARLMDRWLFPRECSAYTLVGEQEARAALSAAAVAAVAPTIDSTEGDGSAVRDGVPPATAAGT